MAIRFNADEILAMAERTEANAAKYYRRAAELHAKENTDFLLRMAAMEEDHKNTFAAMRAKLTEKAKEPTAYDPMDESVLYLNTMADLHGGEGSPEIIESLTGRERLEDILRQAIDLEKKAILFYVGLEPFVPGDLGKDQVNRIIAEEKSHVVILSRELNALLKKNKT